MSHELGYEVVFPNLGKEIAEAIYKQLKDDGWNKTQFIIREVKK